MTTLDGDWQCEQDSASGKGCFAVWQHCEDCIDTPVPEVPAYNGGLVPKGQGLSIREEYGNMWYEQADELADKYDICVSCTGSGGGYACGVHDLGMKPEY